MAQRICRWCCCSSSEYVAPREVLHFRHRLDVAWVSATNEAFLVPGSDSVATHTRLTGKHQHLKGIGRRAVTMQCRRPAEIAVCTTWSLVDEISSIFVLEFFVFFYKISKRKNPNCLQFRMVIHPLRLVHHRSLESADLPPKCFPGSITWAYLFQEQNCRWLLI